MQLDLQYIKQHYDSLSDEALLSLDRSELVEEAQKCYDAELEKRHLNKRPAERGSPDHSAPENTSAEPTPAWLPEGAIVFGKLPRPGDNWTEELRDARKALQDAGIPTFIQEVPWEEEPSTFSSPSHEIRLLVPGNLNFYAASVLDRDIFNQNFEDQWRTHLEMLSDDEVRAMDPKKVFCGLFDKVERVARVYKEELARRF